MHTANRSRRFSLRGGDQPPRSNSARWSSGRKRARSCGMVAPVAIAVRTCSCAVWSRSAPDPSGPTDHAPPGVCSSQASASSSRSATIARACVRRGLRGAMQLQRRLLVGRRREQPGRVGEGGEVVRQGVVERPPQGRLADARREAVADVAARACGGRVALAACEVGEAGMVEGGGLALIALALEEVPIADDQTVARVGGVEEARGEHGRVVARQLRFDHAAPMADVAQDDAFDPAPDLERRPARQGAGGAFVGRGAGALRHMVQQVPGAVEPGGGEGGGALGADAGQVTQRGVGRRVHGAGVRHDPRARACCAHAWRRRTPSSPRRRGRRRCRRSPRARG